MAKKSAEEEENILAAVTGESASSGVMRNLLQCIRIGYLVVSSGSALGV